jgi:protein-L-isoaspartate(D-aspartate) O-methyltransferase
MADQTAQETARENMVDSQVRPNLVRDSRVISAMRALPREAFAPAGAFAYADTDLDLGQGRYMLSPLVTARLAQLVLLAINPTITPATNPAHVLVVGAGSGYTAALLSACGAQVVALEEETRLDTGALARFAPNVEAVTGKLAAGWPSSGPYDAILIEGAVLDIPQVFAAQLTRGGRLVTIMADHDERDGLGRGVVAELTANGFATVKIFDCTARILPSFRRASEFAL